MSIVRAAKRDQLGDFLLMWLAQLVYRYTLPNGSPSIPMVRIG